MPIDQPPTRGLGCQAASATRTPSDRAPELGFLTTTANPTAASCRQGTASALAGWSGKELEVLDEPG